MQSAMRRWNNRRITETAFTVILIVGIAAGWLMSWLASPANVLASAVVLAVPLAMLWRHPVRQSRPELWFALLAMVIHFGIVLYLSPQVLRPYISTDRSDIPGILGAGKSIAALMYGDPLTAVRTLVASASDTTTVIYWVTGLFFFLAAGAEKAVWILFAWFSALGAFYFLKAFRRVLPDRNWQWYALAVFFFPSIAFWSSLPSKDAITFWAIGLLSFGTATFLDKRSWSGLMNTLAAEVVCFAVRRYFVAFCCIPLIVLGAIDLYSLLRRKAYRLLPASFGLLLINFAWLYLLVSNSFFAPNLSGYQATASQGPGIVGGSDIRPISTLPAASTSPSASASPTVLVSPSASMSPAASASPAVLVSPSASVSPATTASPIVSASPAAAASPAVSASPGASALLPVVPWLLFVAERAWYVFTVLFRPMLWEARNSFAVFASIENTVLLVFSLVVVAKLRFIVSRILQEPVLMFAACFAVVFVGAFSLQVINLGTMTRLKIAVLPLIFPFIVLAVGQFQSIDIKGFVKRRIGLAL